MEYGTYLASIVRTMKDSILLAILKGEKENSLLREEKKGSKRRIRIGIQE